MFGKVKNFSYICDEQLNDKDMNENNLLVKFDWAAKRILRDKANFGVLEGLLTVLLKEKITISQILESESNRAFS